MPIEYKSQGHSRWYCRYHVVIVPKYRKRVIIEGHAMPNHIHMLISIPPKYSVAHMIGFMKGKSAIRMHLEFGKRKMHLSQKSFWSRGYCVSTVGMNEEMIRKYIAEQEKKDKYEEGEQLDLSWD